MSKRCPECRYVNDDSRIFCSACGAALDAQLRLIQGLEKQTSSPHEPEPERRRGDVKLYTSRSNTSSKKKSSSLPWVILGLAAVAAVVVWYFFF